MMRAEDEDDADGGDGVDPCCVLLLVVRMHDGLTMMMRGGASWCYC